MGFGAAIIMPTMAASPCGHAARGPSGVFDQSCSHISRAISPGPFSKLLSAAV